ncbi:hypothetical protein BDN71DRAFT_1437302 [Pleurotus eryngii]|uniref:Uncharacterized protein n=1 Tax=Pleurotus eryngii TaxID=5323 RepID=A0A9P5ZEK9_PLEER|nr:hypothetical protein BDN71DRAFT_1437302 [Pleurotus eryngii]
MQPSTPPVDQSDGPIRTQPPQMARGRQDEDILLLYTDGVLHERRKKEGKWRKGKQPCKREGGCLVRLRVYNGEKKERNRGNRETKKRKGKRGKRRKRQKRRASREREYCVTLDLAIVDRA